MKCSYFTGYMELLKQLTVVGDVSREQFEGILEEIFISLSCSAIL